MTGGGTDLRSGMDLNWEEVVDEGHPPTRTWRCTTSDVESITIVEQDGSYSVKFDDDTFGPFDSLRRAQAEAQVRQRERAAEREDAALAAVKQDLENWGLSM